jgi:L-alanine-DL-glutamate epimerase-like enolase superfamily enzyme
VRITRIEAVPVAVPLAEEFHWQGGAQLGANLVLFAVHTEDGVVGWGESVCEVPLATAEFGKAIARQVVGRRVDEIEAILAEIWTRGRWKTTPQFTQFVVSGIESACWDALGRTLGRPTHALFGGAVHPELDFFGVPQGDDAASLAAGARRLADHEVIYLKIGRPRDDDAVVAAVREAIGPEKTLRVDPNEAWDADTAIERIGRLSVHDLDWVEQPVPHWDVDGLARVRAAVDVRVAADQAVYTTPQLERVLEADAADVVVQGPHDAGGLLPFRRQAALCEARGVDVNLHGFVQSEVSFLAHAHVAATVPNLTTGNQVMHQLLAERLTTGIDVAVPAGRYRLPDTPGHGFEIDEDAVGRAHERFQRDGAYVNIEVGGR